jgi:hypothetical protein
MRCPRCALAAARTSSPARAVASVGREESARKLAGRRCRAVHPRVKALPVRPLHRHHAAVGAPAAAASTAGLLRDPSVASERASAQAGGTRRNPRQTLELRCTDTARNRARWWLQALGASCTSAIPRSKLAGVLPTRMALRHTHLDILPRALTGRHRRPATLLSWNLPCFKKCNC